jgi:hypothetical protein
MATLSGNSPVQGMKGSLGELVFRSYHGKTVVTTKPSILRSSKQSELQQLNRFKFRDASRYAKTMIRDDAMKEYYSRKAKKMKLPNAYTAAITDYMRKIKVEIISTKHYTGKAGGRIVIVAHKKDFTISEVQVTITTRSGNTIESGRAIRNTSGEWIYKNTINATVLEEQIIKVDTKDSHGNITHATHRPGYKPFCTYSWEDVPLRTLPLDSQVRRH